MPCHSELVDPFVLDPDWCYFGGGQFTTEYQRCKQAHHHNYFMIAWPSYFKYEPKPDFQEHCECGMEIQQQCYIINIKTKQIIVLGNSCIERLRNGTSRTCGLCHAVHRNRSDNYCNDCRIIIKQQEDAKKLKALEATLCIEEGCMRKKKMWRGKPMPRCTSCYYQNQNKNVFIAY
tara:strand:- start:2538 stop:3065 length:528 start_codon:yes stop_codon:yes gene_type:complete